jgi:hypothetical protein
MLIALFTDATRIAIQVDCRELWGIIRFKNPTTPSHATFHLTYHSNIKHYSIPQESLGLAPPLYTNNPWITFLQNRGIGHRSNNDFAQITPTIREWETPSGTRHNLQERPEGAQRPNQRPDITRIDPVYWQILPRPATDYERTWPSSLNAYKLQTIMGDMIQNQQKGGGKIHIHIGTTKTYTPGFRPQKETLNVTTRDMKTNFNIDVTWLCHAHNENTCIHIAIKIMSLVPRQGNNHSDNNTPHIIVALLKKATKSFPASYSNLLHHRSIMYSHTTSLHNDDIDDQTFGEEWERLLHTKTPRTWPQQSSLWQLFEPQQITITRASHRKQPNQTITPQEQLHIRNMPPDLGGAAYQTSNRVPRNTNDKDNAHILYQMPQTCTRMIGCPVLESIYPTYVPGHQPETTPHDLETTRQGAPSLPTREHQQKPKKDTNKKTTHNKPHQVDAKPNNHNR